MSDVKFTIKPVKSKPVKSITRARKGSDKTKGIKTCYDCQFCFLTGEVIEGLKKYKCSKEPNKTRLIVKIMHKCNYLYPKSSSKSGDAPTADYIQQAYDDVRGWGKKDE